MATHNATESLDSENQPTLFPLMPWPAQAKGLDDPQWLSATAPTYVGSRLSPRVVAAVERLRAKVQRLQAESRAGTAAPANPVPLQIECASAASEQTAFPHPTMDEGYRLQITASGIHLSAPQDWG